ncbi:hypothetical protein [Enterobacter hormaechei]|uniref:hypothetical protein n=1 Tax=Enterobacter hormaechei TaxID=158836 RepID=UPI0034D37C0B
MGQKYILVVHRVRTGLLPRPASGWDVDVTRLMLPGKNTPQSWQQNSQHKHY